MFIEALWLLWIFAGANTGMFLAIQITWIIEDKCSLFYMTEDAGKLFNTLALEKITIIMIILESFTWATHNIIQLVDVQSGLQNFND